MASDNTQSRMHSRTRTRTCTMRAPQAVELVAGAHNCALLAKTGLVLPWGIRQHTQSRMHSPTRTRTCTTHAPQAVKLVAGARHCALLTKTGVVLTWGIGGQGQLGRLPAFDAHSIPPVSELFVPKAVPPNKIPIRATSIATIATGG